MSLNALVRGERPGSVASEPGEKFTFCVQTCQVRVSFDAPASPLEASGSLFVSSRRLVFLRFQDSNVQLRTDDLDSLDVPLNRLTGGRYTIPILTAPYYEVVVKPAPGGGFPQRADGTPTTATLRIWFNEGNGIAFRGALAAAQEQHETERHWEEPLRAYKLRGA